VRVGRDHLRDLLQMQAHAQVVQPGRTRPAPSPLAGSVQALARLYAAARLHTNVVLPSFKLKTKARILTPPGCCLRRTSYCRQPSSPPCAAYGAGRCRDYLHGRPTQAALPTQNRCCSRMRAIVFGILRAVLQWPRGWPTNRMGRR